MTVLSISITPLRHSIQIFRVYSKNELQSQKAYFHSEALNETKKLTAKLFNHYFANTGFL